MRPGSFSFNGFQTSDAGQGVGQMSWNMGFGKQDGNVFGLHRIFYWLFKSGCPAIGALHFG